MKTIAKVALAGVGLLVILVLVLAVITPKTRSAERAEDKGALAAVAPESTTEPIRQRIPWTYEESEDSMTGKKAQFASTNSTNVLSLQFPYQGAQHATLVLRKHPRMGIDAILSIERGQFVCGINQWFSARPL